MKDEIKTRGKISKELFIVCPECGKEIIGTSISQVLYNLKIHSLTHQKEKEIIKNE